MPFGVFSAYSGSGFEVRKLDFPAARRYDVLLNDKIPDRKHVLRRMDVSVFVMSTFARVCPLAQRNVMLLSALWAPLCRRDPLVQDDYVVERLQLHFDRSHARMLDFLPVSRPLPFRELLVLDDDYVISLHPVDELVREILLLVRDLLVLSSSHRVSLPLVARTLFLLRSSLLELLESFTFFNTDVDLAAV